ncbi:glutathione S-transferase [Spectribacter hydrogenoxidans]|uniref:Glutathione S-transferase n=1 Tax=Spectribacter hydrogenoxidans TaxID=3075608 RepID=A0ABU3BWF5_9GAMM|nr:glutathione S-transferase [Salinisphaera sp. W335]MDT0633623.1 glutathione S-transferase [Salinisphaera sp. W335]
MKLYDWSIAPNPRRVRMYLAERDIDIEIIQAGAPDQLDLHDWFLKLNPRRRVPLLELDDGTHIGEAMAICRYFEAAQPASDLFGRDARETGLVEMWEREADSSGLQAGGEHVRNAHPAFKDRALPGYAEPTPQIAELAERGRMRYLDFLKRIDQQLADCEFLAGNIFTVADITAFCTIDFWRKFRLPIPKDAEHLQRWFDAVSQRPSTDA